jgi:hypothetical protein
MGGDLQVQPQLNLTPQQIAAIMPTAIPGPVSSNITTPPQLDIRAAAQPTQAAVRPTDVSAQPVGAAAPVSTDFGAGVNPALFSRLAQPDPTAQPSPLGAPQTGAGATPRDFLAPSGGPSVPLTDTDLQGIQSDLDADLISQGVDPLASIRGGDVQQGLFPQGASLPLKLALGADLVSKIAHGGTPAVFQGRGGTQVSPGAQALLAAVSGGSKHIQSARLKYQATPASAQPEVLDQMANTFAVDFNIQDPKDPIMDYYRKQVTSGRPFLGGRGLITDNPEVEGKGLLQLSSAAVQPVIAAARAGDLPRFLSAIQEEDVLDAIDEETDDWLQRTGQMSEANAKLDRIFANPAIAEKWGERGQLSPDSLEGLNLDASMHDRLDTIVIDSLQRNPEMASMLGLATKKVSEKRREAGVGLETQREEITRGLKHPPTRFSDPYLNETGDLVQRDLNTGQISILSTKKADGSADPSKVAKAEESMRRDFTKLSGRFETLKDMYTTVIASASSPSAAGDISLIFAYMKILDPTSVVREGEQATAASARGVPEGIRTQYNRVLSGERLGDSQRADFVDRATRIMQAQAQPHLQREEVFRALATRNDLDPANVVIDFLGPEMREMLTRAGRTVTQSDINRARSELGEGSSRDAVTDLLISEGMVFPEIK